MQKDGIESLFRYLFYNRDGKKMEQFKSFYRDKERIFSIYILNSCKIKLLNDVHFLNLGLNSYENHLRISEGKNVHVIIYTYLSSDSYIQVQLLLIQSCIIFKLVDQKSGKFAPRGGGIAIFMKHFPKFKHCFDDTY